MDNSQSSIAASIDLKKGLDTVLLHNNVTCHNCEAEGGVLRPSSFPVGC